MRTRQALQDGSSHAAPPAPTVPQLVRLCFRTAAGSIYLAVALIPLEVFLGGREDLAAGIDIAPAPEILRLTPILGLLALIAVSFITGMRAIQLVQAAPDEARTVYGSFVFLGIALCVTSALLGMIYDPYR